MAKPDFDPGYAVDFWDTTNRQDWGLCEHYSAATAAKALSAAYYDKPVRYSYFEGCSNGGRQAMMMAQNYPELFDGIVSGAPSMFYPDLLFWLLWAVYRTMTRTTCAASKTLFPARRA